MKKRRLVALGYIFFGCVLDFVFIAPLALSLLDPPSTDYKAIRHDVLFIIGASIMGSTFGAFLIGYGIRMFKMTKLEEPDTKHE